MNSLRLEKVDDVFGDGNMDDVFFMAMHWRLNNGKQLTVL